MLLLLNNKSSEKIECYQTTLRFLSNYENTTIPFLTKEKKGNKNRKQKEKKRTDQVVLNAAAAKFSALSSPTNSSYTTTTDSPLHCQPTPHLAQRRLRSIFSDDRNAAKILPPLHDI